MSPLFLRQRNTTALAGMAPLKLSAGGDDLVCALFVCPAQPQHQKRYQEATVREGTQGRFVGDAISSFQDHFPNSPSPSIFFNHSRDNSLCSLPQR